MTTTQKIIERDELVKKAEQGEISPRDFWASLKNTHSKMTAWDRFAEFAVLNSIRVEDNQ